ncbi:MAG: MaoC family dehydratase [Candidatus Endonucleobacter bathymodioli]|uniref:MaoC family dehydratase n=1 Tax=Candidatus Endonucleibacter bathymodioli TaxID=539814 RepID=A0AA90NNN5_9GAMM|nr:MaoC family dehydratase [Candidatus Endonucleobacter bathymodioli]
MKAEKSHGINDIEIGMSASITKIITDKDVKEFADLSGDNNPVHLDEEYAMQSRYKKRIAHGLLSSSFFSALFGTKIPGEGCVYVSQTLNFLRAVYIGDTVVATVLVTNINKSSKRVFFETTCTVKNKKSNRWYR